MKFFRYFLLSVLTVFSAQILAQIVSVRAKLDSAQIKIGQQTHLRFEVVQGAETKVQFPQFSDSIISGVEVVSVNKPDTTALEDGKIRINADVLISSYDSALYYIPSFKFISGNDTLETNPLSLKVMTIPVDTVHQPLYDIKSVFSAPIDWVEVATISLIILLIAAAIFFAIWYYLKKRKRKPELVEQKITNLLPHEYAFNELDRVKLEKIWQQARIKEYYTELTTILRQYIELRYSIPALEMTSDELVDRLDMMRELDKESKSILNQVLKLADLVKFAKWTPEFSEHDLTLSNAYQFVQKTKQEIVEQNQDNTKPEAEQQKN